MELVNPLALEEMSAQDWMPTQFEGEWPFPTTCNGRMRTCAAPGRTKCKLRAVMIVRGIEQLAHRLMDVSNPVLAWIFRARHGADNSRAPHTVRRSAKTTAPCPARDSPTCEAWRYYWPDQKALNRPASVRSAAEPQAEPSDLSSDKVVALNADLVPRASKGDSGQSATASPTSVGERIRGPPGRRVFRCVRLRGVGIESCGTGPVVKAWVQAGSSPV